jgi:hypothetical protein
LFVFQPLDLFLQLRQLFIHISGLALLEQPLGLLELFHRLLRRLLLLLGACTVLPLLLHVACGLFEGFADVRHLPVVIFARKPLKLSCKSLRFPLQFLGSHLIAAAATAAALHLLSPAFHSFLLALGELFQFVDSLLNLWTLVHFATLQSLILVLVLIKLEFEQIGKVFCTLASASAASALLAHGHLNLGEQCFGAHQILQCFLLKRLGRAGGLLLQLDSCGQHLLDGQLQIFRQLLKVFVFVAETSAPKTLHQSLRLLSKLGLAFTDGMNVVRPLLALKLFLVAFKVKGRRNDLLLALR